MGECAPAAVGAEPAHFPIPGWVGGVERDWTTRFADSVVETWVTKVASDRMKLRYGSVPSRMDGPDKLVEARYSVIT